MGDYNHIGESGLAGWKLARILLFILLVGMVVLSVSCGLTAYLSLRP